MNRKYFVWSFVLMLVLNKFTAEAQVTPLDSLLVKAFATDELLPMLIDSAIKNSPEVSRIGYTVDYWNDVRKINKNSIFDGVSFNSSYNYGTNFSAVNNPSGIGSTTNLTKAQTGYYNTGIGLQLPFSKLINRKSIIHADQSQVKAAISEKGKAALFVKQEVITIYQEFKLNQKLVVVSGKTKEFALINYKMVEKDFIQAQGTVEAIARVQDIYTKSMIEYETFVNRFQTSFMQLEAITGTDLLLLLKQVK